LHLGIVPKQQMNVVILTVKFDYFTAPFLGDVLN